MVEACYAEQKTWSDTEQRVSSTYRVLTVACQVSHSKGVSWALGRASGNSAAVRVLFISKSVELYLHSHIRLHCALLNHTDKFTKFLSFHEPHMANILGAKLEWINGVGHKQIKEFLSSVVTHNMLSWNWSSHYSPNYLYGERCKQTENLIILYKWFINNN